MPTTEPQKQRTLQIPADMFDDLARLAREADRTVSAEARRALRTWIEDGGDE